MWVKQNYDKFVLFVALSALLASALYLLISINREKKDLEGGWKFRGREKPVVSIDLQPLKEANLHLSRPFLSEGTNRFMVSEVRVVCVNGECSSQIPINAKVCAFCDEVQPDIDITPDRDRDEIPDVWEEKYGLDKFDSNDALADFDGDQYSNLEEYGGNTDPTNRESFPPPGAKLRLEEARSKPFEYLLRGASKKGDGWRFQLNSRVKDRTYFAELNESLDGGYTVIRFEPDAPEGATLWLEKGGVELSLVKGLPREGVDWVAILVSMLDGKRFKVQSQSEVNVKGFAYKVIDIKQNQVLIKDMDTGEQLKVTRLTRTEALTLGRDPGQMAPLRGARGRGGGAPTSGRVLNPRMRR